MGDQRNVSNRHRSNLGWLLAGVGIAGGLLLLASAEGRAWAQDEPPAPTLPPAMWMTPVSGEAVPGLEVPNYLLLGGIALVVLVLLGIIVAIGVAFLARRRKRKKRRRPAVQQPGAGGYVLVVQTGPGVGTRYPVTQGVLVLGRAPDCQVVVNYPNVSGHHARITWDGRQFVVEDLGSTNGTFINGHRLTGPSQFRHNDVLSLGGSVELVLEAGAGR